MTLSAAQQNFACTAINHYSEGAHPEATPESFGFFPGHFVKACLEAMADDAGVRPEWQRYAREVIDALGPVAPPAWETADEWDEFGDDAI